MSYELLNHHLLCFLLTDGDSLWIWDDYFLEMVDIVAIYVISMFYFADGNLG